MRTILIFSLLNLTVLIVSCISQDTVKKNLEPISFSSMWKLDSCGIEGYRKTFIRYYEQKEEAILTGKSLDYVDKYFGTPNEANINEEWNTVHYVYICDAYKTTSQKCGEAVNKTFRLTFDKKTQTIVDEVVALH